MDDLDREFEDARRRAQIFISAHNSKLPIDACPQCGGDTHIPGLRCATCGYRHDVPWIIIQDTEWGYAAIPLMDRNKPIQEFRVRE